MHGIRYSLIHHRPIPPIRHSHPPTHHSPAQPHIHPHTYTPTHLYNHLYTHTHTHPMIHPPTHLYTHPPTHPYTDTLIHSYTHPERWFLLVCKCSRTRGEIILAPNLICVSRREGVNSFSKNAIEDNKIGLYQIEGARTMRDSDSHAPPTHPRMRHSLPNLTVISTKSSAYTCTRTHEHTPGVVRDGTLCLSVCLICLSVYFD